MNPSRPPNLLSISFAPEERWKHPAKASANYAIGIMPPPVGAGGFVSPGSSQEYWVIELVCFGMRTFLTSKKATNVKTIHVTCQGHRMSVLRRFISEHQMSVTLARTIVDFVRPTKSGESKNNRRKVDENWMKVGKCWMVEWLMQNYVDIFWKLLISLSAWQILSAWNGISVEWVGTVQHTWIAPVNIWNLGGRSEDHRLRGLWRLEKDLKFTR